VVLAGGCFQNPILLDALESRLGGDTEVLRSMRLPPGDGGLSFGQALVADAVASRPSRPSRRTDGEES
jgi:hydrogenase maturation protein HypF